MTPHNENKGGDGVGGFDYDKGWSKASGNQVDNRSVLAEEIAASLNRASRENISNSPDFILAEYLLRCLEAFESATIRRDAWYDFDPHSKLTGGTDLPTEDSTPPQGDLEAQSPTSINEILEGDKI